MPGAVTPAQLESNLAALKLDMDAADLEQLTTLAEPPERYWKERAALTWS